MITLLITEGFKQCIITMERVVRGILVATILGEEAVNIIITIITITTTITTTIITITTIEEITTTTITIKTASKN